jgi:hypothetical protein
MFIFISISSFTIIIYVHITQAAEPGKYVYYLETINRAWGTMCQVHYPITGPGSALWA